MSVSNTLQVNNVVVDLGAPTINSVTPADEAVIYSLLPEFVVEATDASSLECKLQLYNDDDELIVEWDYENMVDESGMGWSYTYKMVEADDYLVTGSFKIKVTVRDEFDNEVSQTNTFTIAQASTEMNILSISRNFDGSSKATVTFRIKDLSECRVDLRFFLNLLIRANHCKLIELQSSTVGDIIGDNVVSAVKTTEDWATYSMVVKYNTATELENFTNELKKGVVEVGHKIEITKYSGGSPLDMTKFVTSVNFDRNVDLGAKQLNISFRLCDDTNPFHGASPYVYYGNTIVYTQKLNVNGTIEEEQRFTGKISSMEVTKNTVELIAYDDFVKFNNAINEDLAYSPTKFPIGRENLRTFDGIKFGSNHLNWSQYPPPEIYLGTTKLEPGEYQVDYYRGIIYIYRNVFLAGDWIERNLNVDDYDDRKTFLLNYNIDSNSSLLIYHKYQEKVDYACVDGVEEGEVWIDKRELYTEPDDYNVDYETNEVILASALPSTTSIIRNHFIHITSRAIDDISASYSYLEEGTNEAEDIIRDIAEKVGFDNSTQLQKTVTDESVESGDGTFYYTEKNNIKTITNVKVNGVEISDYELKDAKDGKIKMDSPGYAPVNILVDPLESINNLTISESGDTMALNSDSQYGDYSVKAIMSIADEYITKNYDFTYFRKNLINYNRFALYLKIADVESGGLDSSSEMEVKVTLANNDDNSQEFTFDLSEDTWTKCTCDISALDWRNDICSIKIAVASACTLYFDYFHIPKDEVTITYIYYTLQSTEVTINEVYFFREEIDNALDIVEQVLDKCEPSYIVNVDRDGYLIGDFHKIRWSLLQTQVYKNTGFDFMAIAGKFLLEEYRLNMVTDPHSSISDEHLYTSILVCGKLSDRYNVAMEATDIINNATWHDEAVAYSSQGTSTLQKAFPPYAFNATIVKIREDQETDVYSWNGQALVDNDIYTGLWWYMTSKDANDRPDSATLMTTITLKEGVYWEEIAMCIGAYKNKVIRQEMYIKVVGENASEWFPEGETANKQNGNTGTWLIWKNSFNRDKKITHIKVYLSDPWAWITSTAVTNSKK